MKSSEQKEGVVDARWIQLRVEGEKLRPRTNHASAISNGVMYMYGGYDMEIGMLDDFFAMALNQDKYVWRLMPVEGKHSPGPRRNHTLCADDSTVYLFGGQVNGTQSSQLLHRYSLDKRIWERSQPLTVPCLDSHCSFLHGGSMYIYGGYQAEWATYNEEIYTYDIATRRVKCVETTGRKPPGRCSFSLSLYKNSFYVFGGCNQINLNDLWSFNIGTSCWMEIESPNTLWPEPRRGHSLAAYSGHLFLFGGIQSITKERNDIYVFDMQQQAWSKVQQNCNESYKLSSQKKAKTEQSAAPSPQRRLSRRRESARGCQFNLTITSFGNINRKTMCQFAQTSLYRKRGQPQLFSSVIRSKSTIVEENRRRSFKQRKEKMLSEFNIFGTTIPQRKLSPMSQAMKFSLKTMGLQHQRHLVPEKQLTVPAIRYDSQHSFLIGKKPCARDGQTAVVYRDYIVIFGGDRHMMSFNDIYLFRMDKALKQLLR